MEAETNEVNIYELSCLNLTASLLSLHYYPCYRWGIARIHGKCQSWALNWDLTPKLCLIHMWASEDFFFTVGFYQVVRPETRWAEQNVQVVLFLLTFHTQVLKLFLVLYPHSFLLQYSHPWQGKSLTILRIFLCRRVEEGEESNVVSQQRGNPSFDEISCVVTLELGFPQSEVTVACCC